MVLVNPADAQHFAGPVIAIRPATADELPYIRGAFAEGYKQSSNQLAKLPWSTYKRDVRPRLYQALDGAAILVADHGGEVAGWIALAPGRRVDTVHWITTRLHHRGRGVMRALVEAARLKERIVYTHRGPKRSDESIAQWLAARGAVSVVYEPYERWK